MRHIPEAGAVCGNSARTDLCGGRGVTSVPTATKQSGNCSERAHLGRDRHGLREQRISNSTP